MHRLTVLLMAAAASAAHAELYRWVDPQTGSVKFSNSPPAWIEGTKAPAPRVDVIPYGGKPEPEAAPAAPAAVQKPAAALPKPEAASATPEAAAPRAEAASDASALEAAWRRELQGMTALVTRPNLDLGNLEVQQQIQRYESLSAELDRRDPGGIARRRAEQASVAERLRSKPAAAAK